MMGTIDIILTVITFVICVSGGCIAIKSIIDTRNNSIKKFSKNSEQRNKEFENGLH